VAGPGIPAPAPAQDQAPPPPLRQPPAPSPADEYEGRPIREIRLLRPAGPDGAAEPLPDSLAQLVRNQLRSLEGRPFQRQIVSHDISLLNRLGRFRTIRSDVQLLEDGTVRLTYTLQEQPTIQDVQVIGNRELSDQDLLSGVGVLAGTPVDRFQIDRSTRAIEDRYRARGFHRVRVEVDEKVLEESAIVVFRVIEGERVKVMGVGFRGNRAFSDRELSTAVKTTEFVPIFEKGPLDSDTLAEDEASLVRYYRDRGYLDARAGHSVTESLDGREAIVTFEIDEGLLYTLRSVQAVYVSREAIRRYREDVLKDPQAEVKFLTAAQMRQIGRRPLTDEQLTGLMEMKPGDAYGMNKLRKSLDNIRGAYAKLGYILDTARGPVPAFLETREIRDAGGAAGPEVDLLILIEEGRPTMTGDIRIIGNELTKQQVILHEMRLGPGRPLDLELVEESRKNIEDRRLFSPGLVRITPARQTDPNERDLTVEVVETNTGSFNIGASLGSDNGVSGRFALVQRNFDLADTPDTWGELFSGRAFRGAGQTFDLELQPGSQVSLYSLTITDPTLLDSDYSGSGSVFFRDRKLREYDERRYGVRTSLGRRFGTLWTGSIALRNEWVDISDIDEDKPTDVFKSDGLARITGFGVEMIRNTADDRIRPTRGSRLQVGAEQVGALGGEYDFTKLSFSYTTFFTVYESFLGYKTVLKLQNQIGYIPQGQDASPVYERYYLGGQSFRGFNFRAISPTGTRHDNGEPSDDVVGGSWLFFAGAELNQPFYQDVVSGVVFMDTGTVQRGFGFSDYRVSAGVGLRLYIRQLSPVPLAFDFGFPILSQDTDRERVFTFTIDLPFQ
jgi:outer membrane protein insertion porin family